MMNRTERQKTDFKHTQEHVCEYLKISKQEYSAMILDYGVRFLEINVRNEKRQTVWQP